MLEQKTLEEFAMVARRGAENAGETLSRWLHRPVSIEVSSVDLIRLDLIPDQADDLGATTVTLASRVNGELPGNVVVQLSLADAASLVGALGGKLSLNDGAIGDMERSMLQETANILFSSLMNSLAHHLGLNAVPYAPAVMVDIGTAAWDMLLLEAAEEADEAVVVTARLVCPGCGPTVRLVFLPAPHALDVIRQELGDDR